MTGEGGFTPAQVVWVDSDNRVVIVALDDRGLSPLVLNAVAAEMWRQVWSGLTEAEIVHSLAADFGVTEAAAREGLEGFVADCRSRGVIQSY